MRKSPLFPLLHILKRGDFLDANSLPFAVSALAEAIAAGTPDDGQLALLAAALTQLGDTLNTILVLRSARSS